MFHQAILKEVPHVPRPRSPPRPAILNGSPPSEPPLILPLDQLWMRLPSDRRQEVLQRLTQMMVQQLALSHDPREASHE